MDAGALEVHLRRLPGVVACQLTATEVVLLVGAGDPAAVRIAAQAALDQAGSASRIRVLAAPPLHPAVAPWRRRRFAVLAGAAGALSAGIAAATTLASMPGAVSPAADVAIAVPEADDPSDRGRGVRTLVPAPSRPDAAASGVAGPAEAEAVLVEASAPVPAPMDLAGAATVASVTNAPARVATPPAAPATTEPSPAPVPSPPPPAPAVAPEPGMVAAASDEDDDRPGRGRGREGRQSHPHGDPPGYLQRAGHGPW